MSNKFITGLSSCFSPSGQTGGAVRTPMSSVLERQDALVPEQRCGRLFPASMAAFGLPLLFLMHAPLYAQNTPPDVDAGVDQTVYEDASVTLSATATDADSDNLTYMWSHDAPPAPGLTVSDLNMAEITFTAPAVIEDTTIVFTVTVNDGTEDVTDTVAVKTESSAGAFITTWRVESAAVTTITVTNTPTTAGSYTVDWGDGTPRSEYDCSAATACPALHEYTDARDYRVIIVGTGFQNIVADTPAGNAARLLEINQWGTIGWTTMRGAFLGASNMRYSATDTPDLSDVTDMAGMFAGAAAFNGDLDSWDVSNVEDMNFMFTAATTFNGAIGKWNVSNVLTMEGMFERAVAFNGDIGGWYVSSVTNMEGMFESASAFNGAIGSWDVSNVEDMSLMFAAATAFDGAIGEWDVSSVTTMRDMFLNAAAFNQDIGSWDVSNVDNMAFMFAGAAAFNSAIGSWDVSNVEDMRFMFAATPDSGTPAFNGAIGGWDVSNVRAMEGMFEGASAFNQDIGSWDVSNVTDMEIMFARATAFNQNLNRWDVSSVTDMTLMFVGATAFNQNLARWYIQIDSLTIADGAAGRTVGTIAAQNSELSAQSPTYAVSTTSDDDSALFEIDSDMLRLKSEAPAPSFAATPFYTVTLTAEGSSLFGMVAPSRQVRVQVTTTTQTVATGAPEIVGVPEVGNRLRASTDGIFDANGLDAAVYSYQWIRQDAAVDANAPTIAGATGPTYRLTAEDKRRYIAVRVMFADDADNPETLTSAAVKEIDNLPVISIIGERTRTVSAGEIVTLAGKSEDPDGDDVIYNWKIPMGIEEYTFPYPAGRVRFTAPSVDEDTDFVFTLVGSDPVGVVTAQVIVKVVREPMAIDPSQLAAIAPGATTLEFEGSVYAVVPGHDAHGGVIDAQALIGQSLHASLAACIVRHREVETGAVLDQGRCHIGPHLRHLQRPVPVVLTSDMAPRLHVPHYNSVLYFIDRETSIIRAFQRVYVAPLIGFVASMQTQQSGADTVTLPLRGPAADADYEVELAFIGNAARSVLFVANAAMPTRAQVEVTLDANAEQVRLDSINGITFAGTAADDLSDVAETILIDRRLFALGNDVTQLVDPPAVEESVTMSMDLPFMADQSEPSSITFTSGYLTQISVFSTPTQSFELFILDTPTTVTGIVVGRESSLAFLDAEDNTVMSATVNRVAAQVANRLMALPILRLGVETDADGFREETVFGSTRAMICSGGNASDCTLAQGATALAGPYASIGQVAMATTMASVSAATASVLNLPDLPGGRTATDAAAAGHLFDFIVELDQAEDVAVIVLTLDTPAPAGARYYKYREDTAEWVLFDTSSGNDRIYSAPRPCPGVGAARTAPNAPWQSAANGMRAGDSCLLLEIHDGSANDADRLSNGYVVDAGSLDAGSLDAGGDTGSGSGSSGGGGGVIGLWWLLGSIIMFCVFGVRRLAARRLAARQ